MQKFHSDVPPERSHKAFLNSLTSKSLLDKDDEPKRNELRRCDQLGLEWWLQLQGRRPRFPRQL